MLKLSAAATLLCWYVASPAAAQQPRAVTIGWGAYTDVPQIAQVDVHD